MVWRWHLGDYALPAQGLEMFCVRGNTFESVVSKSETGKFKCGFQRYLILTLLTIKPHKADLLIEGSEILFAQYCSHSIRNI